MSNGDFTFEQTNLPNGYNTYKTGNLKITARIAAGTGGVEEVFSLTGPDNWFATSGIYKNPDGATSHEAILYLPFVESIGAIPLTGGVGIGLLLLLLVAVALVVVYVTRRYRDHMQSNH
ncbi:MAG: hypothetical protein J6575_01540 [Bifidobacterium sp.]|nr:hypothetical protein [Bifidobacterium sp.]